MSAQTKYLERHGWTLISSTRRGMHLIKRWHKPGRGVMGQADAIAIQRSTLKYERLCKATAQTALPLEPAQ